MNNIEINSTATNAYNQTFKVLFDIEKKYNNKRYTILSLLIFDNLNIHIIFSITNFEP